MYKQTKVLTFRNTDLQSVYASINKINTVHISTNIPSGEGKASSAF